MQIQILIPCLNEAPSISRVIGQIRDVLPQAGILVCDNGSTDRTADLAREACAEVVSEPVLGKGNAVRKLFSCATGDICVLMDGDLTYDAGVLPKIIKQFEEEQLDFLNVARLATHKDCYPIGRKWGNKVLNSVMYYVAGIRLRDILSGYKVFSQKFIKSYRVESNGFEIEAELVMAVVKSGLRYAETTAPYYARAEHNPSKLHLVKDGVRIFRQILKTGVNKRKR